MSPPSLCPLDDKTQFFSELLKILNWPESELEISLAIETYIPASLVIFLCLCVSMLATSKCIVLKYLLNSFRCGEPMMAQLLKCVVALPSHI